MQTLASHWDTSGGHLAPEKCADTASVVEFAYWWHDARAQEIIAALIACDNEIGIDHPLASADAELASIYNEHASELRFDECDENYIDDLMFDTPTAERVACDPWKYCLAGGAA